MRSMRRSPVVDVGGDLRLVGPRTAAREGVTQRDVLGPNCAMTGGRLVGGKTNPADVVAYRIQLLATVPR